MTTTEATTAPFAAACHTTSDIAARYRVAPDKVRLWIQAGLLAAVNVAAPNARRPQWRISDAAVERFEQQRQAPPPPPPRQQRKRRTTPPPDIIEYY